MATATKPRTGVMAAFVVNALIGFVAIAGILLAFAMTTPLYAGPDEPQQVIKSAAVVRGQLDDVSVTVPKWAAESTVATCFAFNANANASCQYLPSDSETQPVTTTAMYAGYNPLYYAVVGWPSLIWSGDTAVYAMRIVSLALCALLLGAGFGIVRVASRNPWWVIGYVATLAPQTLFLGGSISPSSLEIAASTLAWVGMLAAFHAFVQRSPTSQRYLYAILGTIGLCVLLPTRLFSPMWALLIVMAAILATRMSWSAIWAFVRNRVNLILVVVIAVVTVIAIYWTVSHPEATSATTELTVGGGIYQSLRGIFLDYAGSSLPQTFGSLGWLDTPISWAPLVFVAAWASLSSLVFANVRAHRPRLVIVLVLAGAILIPSIFEGVFWGGVGWQGRYTIPLVIGIPLVAGFTMNLRAEKAKRLQRARGARWIPWVVVVTALLALAINYHRYAIGYDAAWDPTTFPWHSPTRFAIWAVVAVVCTVALAVLANYRTGPRWLSGPAAPRPAIERERLDATETALETDAE